ncbi:DUSAM domain-containing protein [Pyxidicoccus parkwayensis]|uniref:DUSAM domain-containing protein n=1 Tax=Pyxidicoccus parkwayensis TaxID=2813578 RepID=A0ABX7NY03_9BACT|nr:DUSAM domain-containing protein [Pyxidicoccus parkwaysis]QSQ23775.1 DUSAM domain-containing protein [Pyxidicoccus parkwaysis]
MADELEWEPVRDLARRVRNGEALTLTEDVKTLLTRTAPEVGISDAAAASAVSSRAGAEALLLECARRIKEGSDRIVDALYRAKRHRKAGDFDSARQEMMDVLAVEVVPLYREIAQDQLDAMADEA